MQAKWEGAKWERAKWERAKWDRHIDGMQSWQLLCGQQHTERPPIAPIGVAFGCTLCVSRMAHAALARCIAVCCIVVMLLVVMLLVVMLHVPQLVAGGRRAAETGVC